MRLPRQEVEEAEEQEELAASAKAKTSRQATLKKVVKREVKKKPAKPKQEKTDVTKATDDSGSLSDDSSAIKSDILSLAERLAQKKSNSLTLLQFIHSLNASFVCCKLHQPRNTTHISPLPRVRLLTVCQSMMLAHSLTSSFHQCLERPQFLLPATLPSKCFATFFVGM